MDRPPRRKSKPSPPPDDRLEARRARLARRLLECAPNRPPWPDYELYRAHRGQWGRGWGSIREAG